MKVVADAVEKGGGNLYGVTMKGLIIWRELMQQKLKLLKI